MVRPHFPKIPLKHPPLTGTPLPARNLGTSSIYVLLLAYAASTATTTLPCIAVVLATPVSATSLGPGLSITSEQRLLLLSSYIPFFLVPLVMALDMAARVSKLAGDGARARRAVKEE